LILFRNNLFWPWKSSRNILEQDGKLRNNFLRWKLLFGIDARITFRRQGVSEGYEAQNSCRGGIIETLDLLDDLDYIVRPLSIDGED
jgi:hypothetical protein